MQLKFRHGDHCFDHGIHTRAKAGRGFMVSAFVLAAINGNQRNFHVSGSK